MEKVYHNSMQPVIVASSGASQLKVTAGREAGYQVCVKKTKKASWNRPYRDVITYTG